MTSRVLPLLALKLLSPTELEKRFKYQGLEKIPNLPSIIVVPDAVFHQWCSEFQKFIDSTALALVGIKHADDTERAKALMDGRNVGAQGAKLFIVALNSLKKDFKIRFTTRGVKPDADGLFPRTATHPMSTVYDYKWNVVWVDEIHEVRNPGDKFNAALALFRLGTFTGGMSATPLVTKLEDVPMIGRAVGFDWLREKAGAQYIEKLRIDMNKQRAHAASNRTEQFKNLEEERKKQKKAKKEGAAAADSVHATILELPDFKTLNDQDMIALIHARLKTLLNQIQHHFVRRHKQSLQPNGKTILALPELVIIPHVLRPTKAEFRFTRKHAQAFLKRVKAGTLPAGDPYVSICRRTRKAILLHIPN